MRFMDTIEGLNNVFETDIPVNSIVLMTGAPGTLKSGFTFSMLSEYLDNKGEYGLYITLEQSKEAHIKNMESMGLEISDRLYISDFSDYRLQFEEMSGDLLSVIETNIMQFKKKLGDKFTCVAIDSLGALYSLIDVEPGDLRKRLFHLFEPLRRENLTTFLILETPDVIDANHSIAGIEGYLADGIIELGIHLSGSSVNRYLRVRKMRASAHSMEPWILTVSDEGLKVYKGMTF